MGKNPPLSLQIPQGIRFVLHGQDLEGFNDVPKDPSVEMRNVDCHAPPVPRIVEFSRVDGVHRIGGAIEPIRDQVNADNLQGWGKIYVALKHKETRTYGTCI